MPERTRVGRALIVPTADETEWLAERAKGMSGTDVAAAMGLPGAYSDPLTVYKRKRGEATDTVDNDAMYWGRKVEALLRERFMSETKDRVDFYQPTGVLVHPQHEWIRGTPDGVYFDAKSSTWRVWEGKTAGSRKDWDDERWKGIPARYYAQVQWYMLITGLQGAVVSVLFNGNQYAEYPVPVDLVFQREAMDKAFELHTRIIEGRAPEPTGHPSCTEVLRQAALDAGKEVDIPGAIAERFAAAAEAKRRAQAEYDYAANQVRALMSDAAYANSGGVRIARRVSYKARVLDVRKLRHEEPRIWERYSSEQTREVLYASLPTQGE